MSSFSISTLEKQLTRLDNEKTKFERIANNPVNPNGLTDNGVPNWMATQLQDSNTSIFTVSSQSPTKESAGAGGASMFSPTNSNGGGEGNVTGENSIFTVDNNSSVLSAGATGHTPQVQAPTLSSALTATSGNENADQDRNATETSKQILQDIYSQYQETLNMILSVESGEDISTGEGTLSVGDAGQTDGAEGIGSTGVSNGTEVDNPEQTDDLEGANDPTNNTPDKEEDVTTEVNDSSNNSTNSINKQAEIHQLEVLNSNLFKRIDLEEQAG